VALRLWLVTNCSSGLILGKKEARQGLTTCCRKEAAVPHVDGTSLMRLDSFSGISFSLRTPSASIDGGCTVVWIKGREMVSTSSGQKRGERERVGEHKDDGHYSFIHSINQLNTTHTWIICFQLISHPEVSKSATVTVNRLCAPAYTLSAL